MQKVLVINGNPDPESLSGAMANAYKQGVEKIGGTCNVIHLHELQFDPILHYGFRKRIPFEPDLEMAQQAIKDCAHLVFIYPVWWGTYPALLKGFIDRVFMPGFAFKSIENSVHWTKLLKGRSGRIIESMDAPMWFYEDVYKSPAKNSLSIAVMNYCGIKPVDYTVFRPIKGSTHEDRQAWISEVEELGKTDFNNLTEKSMQKK